jgi:hypothetical protein
MVGFLASCFGTLGILGFSIKDQLRCTQLRQKMKNFISYFSVLAILSIAFILIHVILLMEI